MTPDTEEPRSRFARLTTRLASKTGGLLGNRLLAKLDEESFAEGLQEVYSALYLRNLNAAVKAFETIVAMMEYDAENIEPRARTPRGYRWRTTILLELIEAFAVIMMRCPDLSTAQARIDDLQHRLALLVDHWARTTEDQNTETTDMIERWFCSNADNWTSRGSLGRSIALLCLSHRSGQVSEPWTVYPDPTTSPTLSLLRKHLQDSPDLLINSLTGSEIYLEDRDDPLWLTAYDLVDQAERFLDRPQPSINENPRMFERTTGGAYAFMRAVLHARLNLESVAEADK